METAMRGEQDILRKVVDRYSPDEVFLVDNIDNLSTGSAARGPNGIGLEITISVITPIVWNIITHFSSDFMKAFSKEIAERLAKFAVGKISDKPSEYNELVGKIDEALRRNSIDTSRYPGIANLIAKECLQKV